MPDDKLHLEHPVGEPPSYEEATEPDTDGPQSTFINEKTALRQNEQFHHEPAPPYSGPSKPQCLTYTLTLHRSAANEWKLSVGEPPGTRWQLSCDKTQKAKMLRFFPDQMALPKEERLPGVKYLLPKEVATVKFPQVKWSGPKITFAPHEAEIERKGLRHVSATDRLMECSGFFSTKYALDLPALNSSRVAWKVPDEDDEIQALKLEAAQQAAKLLAATDEKKASPPELAREADAQSWSPFPMQYLIEETTGRVLATYSRAAPWAKMAGLLTIPQGSEPVTEELVEGIAISCAVMVGMQYKSGLFTSLVESGYESIAGTGKGKGRALG